MVGPKSQLSSWESGRVIASDILPLDALRGVEFLQGDFTEDLILEKLKLMLPPEGADLVISDMAPNLTGIKTTDQSRNLAQAELVLVFCTQTLKADGNLLIKLFEGEGIKAFRELLKQKFDKVLVRKPSASRDKSREFYILARSFRL